MKKNNEYQQIYLNTMDTYDDLKGKVVDKIGYSNIGYADENIFIKQITGKY